MNTCTVATVWLLHKNRISGSYSKVVCLFLNNSENEYINHESDRNTCVVFVLKGMNELQGATTKQSSQLQSVTTTTNNIII